MPHFENIEKYEVTDPKSGRKEILPIAPHSLQAAEYQPRKREGQPVVKKAKLPEFPEVKFEPVSVEQMEKEFKQAGRQRARDQRARQPSLLKRLSKWLSGLLRRPGAGKAPDRRRGRDLRPGKGQPQQPGKAQQPGQPGQGGQGAPDGGRSGRRRRRPRSGQPQSGGRQQDRGRTQSGDRQQDQNRTSTGGRQQDPGRPPAPPQSQGEGGQNRNRNRRNRRRPSKDGNSGANTQD